MTRRYTLACLDMAGTTISDEGIVEEAAAAAIAAEGLSPGTVAHAQALEIVRETMGQSKIAVFRRILGRDERAAVRANAAFEVAYADRVHLGRVRPLPGAAEAITALRAAGVTVAFTTGFSAATQQSILDTLEWSGLADLALTPGSGLRGRPSPDLVLHAAIRAGVNDVREIIVAGDSMTDMRCGVASGAGLIAGVLGGAHTADQLTDAGATHLLDSVADLPGLLT